MPTRPNLPGALTGDDMGATLPPTGTTHDERTPSPGETLHAFPVPLPPPGSPNPDLPAVPGSVETTTLREREPAAISGLDKTAVSGSGLSGRPSLDKTLPRVGDPRKIHRFAVLRQIGAGGMGVVYAGLRRGARSPGRDQGAARRQVASQGRSRMLREAQAMAKLSHPNVVQVYEVGVFAEQVFVAMEFVKGATLGEWLRAEERELARRSSRCICRPAAASRRRTRRASSTATSSPTTCSSAPMVASRVLDFGLARADERPRARHRLRAGPRRHPGGRRFHQPDDGRRDHGYAGVHVARAAPRRVGRRPQRSVQLLRRPLRRALRAGPVRR